MPERLKWILQLACLALAGLVVYQLIQAGVGLNPLDGLTIPDLPSLPREAAARSGPGGIDGAPSMPSPDNGIHISAKVTNGNAAPLAIATNAPLSNAVATLATNTVEAQKPAGTNASAPAAVAAVNTAGHAAPAPPGDAAAAAFALAAGGHVGGHHGPGASRAAALPPAIQARVDRITESEILGPFMRPAPMALMGIAGQFVFLRAPSGQTGLVKEGDELGGVKLLRIGINRVLVEDQGQKKELMIFNGYGGESLLPKEDTSHGTNN
jgi:hypothetical protein